MSSVVKGIQRVGQLVPEGQVKNLLKRSFRPVRDYLVARSNAHCLYGEPDLPATSAVNCILDPLRWGKLGRYVWLSRQIPGWTRGAEAVALARASQSLAEGAVVVEIGSLLGSFAVLLADARKLRGSGKVHCIDPFDASGDAFSEPIYQAIHNSLTGSLRLCFDAIFAAQV